MTLEERELSIEYLEKIKEDYIDNYGDERCPLPEYYAIESAIHTMKQYERLKAITSKSDYVLTAIEMGLPLIIGFIIGKCLRG